jgi:signal recognition particle receptor subunit beta
MSMDVNYVENVKLPCLENYSACVIDIPGQGFFKTKIIDTLQNSKIIITFLDATEKASISLAAEYLYDILNNENFDEMTPIIVACNKQDLKFPKSKKIVESDMANEIENIKQIRQKNNLEDSSQIGALFSMRTKFNFSMFKNVQFVETDKKSGFESVINLLKSLL